MTAHLLDANILIALIDADHVHHAAVNRWFEATGHHSWATCPLTENALLRIVGNPKYVNSPGPPAAVAILLNALKKLGVCEFWPDDLSLASDVPGLALLNSAQLTDTYLLAMAARRGGRFVTIDRGVVADAVEGGRDALLLLEP